MKSTIPPKQAHWLVTLACTHPKPAKELVLRTHRLTVIMHETLTAGILNCRAEGLLMLVHLAIFRVNRHESAMKAATAHTGER